MKTTILKKLMILSVMGTMSFSSLYANDEKQLMYTSAGLGVTTLVVISANIVPLGVTYSKFLTYYTPIMLVAITAIGISEKYKKRKAAKLEAQSVIMNGESLDSLSPTLKSSIVELRNDLKTAIASRNLSGEVLEKLDSLDDLNAQLNNDGYLITVLANL